MKAIGPGEDDVVMRAHEEMRNTTMIHEVQRKIENIKVSIVDLEMKDNKNLMNRIIYDEPLVGRKVR